MRKRRKDLTMVADVLYDGQQIPDEKSCARGIYTVRLGGKTARKTRRIPTYSPLVLRPSKPSPRPHLGAQK